jgi:hypothetical protein
MGVVLSIVVLVAALIGHVVIDILGDVMLAHDTYDDVDHSSRGIVALAALAAALCGIAFGFGAALREANGSENEFCSALRSALPRRSLPFTFAAIVAATLLLCLMEGCDALLAGHDVDDLGDLFGGSVAFGGTIVALTAALVSIVTLAALRRLARARIIAVAIVEFLRRRVAQSLAAHADRSVRRRLVFHARVICRRLAGRAPPTGLLIAIS